MPEYIQCNKCGLFTDECQCGKIMDQHYKQPTPPPSDTPRTDVMMKFCFGTDEEYIRLKDVHLLERELAAKEKEIEVHKEAQKVLNDTIKVLIQDRNNWREVAEELADNNQCHCDNLSFDERPCHPCKAISRFNQLKNQEKKS